MKAQFAPTTSKFSPPQQQEISRSPNWRVALLPWFIPAISIALIAFALLLKHLNSSQPAETGSIQANDVVMAVLFPIVGALIASRQPKNAVGWIVCAMGLAEGLADFSGEYAVYALLTPPHVYPFGAEFSWLAGWDWIVGIGIISLLLLLFPNGSFLSRRWRWLGWLSCGATLLMILSTAIPTWSHRGVQLLSSMSTDTTGNAGITGIYGFIYITGTIVLILSVPFDALCLIIRLRRAKGRGRQQLKWFTYAAALVALDLLVSNVYETYYPRIALLTTIEQAVQALFLATLPLAIGIAILRHRLYGIDVIINRTLVYGSLTAILALLYFGSVVALQYLFRTLTGQEFHSELVIVASTLVIAALFPPLRGRIQRMIDRRFYRRKYNAHHTIEAFNAALRQEIDLAELQQHLLQVVEETMQPTSVSLLLRSLDKTTLQEKHEL